MSRSSDLPTTDASNAAPVNPKHYTAKAQTCDCLRFLFSFILFVVILGLVPAVTRGLIFLQPRNPEFKVESYALAIVNGSSNPVVAKWNLTMSVKNPNGKPMLYDQIAGFALSGNYIISNITIASLKLPGTEQDRFQAVFPGLSLQVNNCPDEYSSSGKLCGGVELRMELQGRARYGGWTWPVKEDSIEVVCEDVKAGFTSNVTTLVMGPSRCDNTGNWKRLVSRFNRIFWAYVYVLLVILFVLSVSL